MRLLRSASHLLLVVGVLAGAACRRDTPANSTPATAPTAPALASAPPKPTAPIPRADSILTRRGASFYLHGEPFTEISFNKFDLFWQILSAEFGRKDHGPEPLAAAERSLALLEANGFQTIRAFFHDYGRVDTFLEPDKRERFFAAMDRTLDLCDRHGIRVVVSLGLGDPKWARHTGEPYSAQIGRYDSRARQHVEDYARAVVTRYRDRPTIAMWQHCNELLLKADIGGRERSWNNLAIPTLTEIERFHREMAILIHSLSPRHLVTTGDTYRTSLWHQNQHVEHGATHSLWTTDSWAQLSGTVARVQTTVDVFGIHAYEAGADSKFTLEPDGSRRPVDYAAWVAVAAAQRQPLYIGELGALPRVRDPKNAEFWERNPDWFTSYAEDREKALPIVAATLEKIVSARVPLTHWWAFDSARAMDQRKPWRMDFTPAETPEFIALVADANRRLQLAVLGFTYARTPVPVPFSKPASAP